MSLSEVTTGRARLSAVEWLLVCMPLIALVPKCLLIWHTLGASGAQIYQTGFGFGDYVRSLSTDAAYRSCSNPPYRACVQVCNYATRMPLLPLLYAGLATLVGPDSAAIAMAKCALTSLLSAIFLYAFVRDVRPSVVAITLLFCLYLGPQSLKHGASVEYEEGLLVDLQLCLAIAITYLWRPELTNSLLRRSTMGVAAVALATAMYFAKTTALLTLLVTLAVVICSQRILSASKVIALICVALPMALWVRHNYSTSGAIHFSSSWNGENLYRGSSAEGLALYPDVLLDRMFDSTRATLRHGRVVLLPALSERVCFRNEWEWDRFYAAQARAWALSHPVDWMHFELRKFWAALIEPRRTPFSDTGDGTETRYPAVIELTMLAWMIFARAIFLGLLVLLVRSAVGRPHTGLRWMHTRVQALWALAFLLAGWAPYLAVFNYQRHLIPLLIMAGTLFCSLFLVTPRFAADRRALTR
jgi:hypothetical protein